MDHANKEESIGERGFNDEDEEGMQMSRTLPPPEYFTVMHQLQRTSESGSTAAPLFHDVFLEVEGNPKYGHVECRSYRTQEIPREVEFSADFRMPWEGEPKDRLLWALGRCSTVADIWMKHLIVEELEAVLIPMQSNLTLLRISIYDPQPTQPTGDPEQERVYEILGNILRSSRTLNRLSLVDGSYRFTLTAAGANYLASGLRDNSQSALASLEIWKLEEGSVVKHIAEIVSASASLTTLHLEKIGGLEDDAIDVFANALDQSKSLKYLSLGGIRQGAPSLLFKIFVIGSNLSISSLVLKDDVEGMGGILLRLLLSSLSHLVLDNKEWMINLTSSQWREVGHSLRFNGSLERFIFKVPSSWSWISPLEEMVTAAGVNKLYVELFLHSESSQTLWYRSLENLQLLSMERTSSSEETAFSRSETKRSVIELHMVSDTGFSNTWVTIAEAVASRSISLSALYLQMEPGPVEGVEGVHSFLGALQENSTVQKLTIVGGNARKWPGGWRSLFTSLRRNIIIAELELLHCEDLDDDNAFEVLMEVLQVNKTLKLIRVHGSSWERNGRGALINEALKRSEEQESYSALVKDAGMKKSGLQGGELFSHPSTSTDGKMALVDDTPTQNTSRSTFISNVLGRSINRLMKLQKECDRAKKEAEVLQAKRIFERKARRIYECKKTPSLRPLRPLSPLSTLSPLSPLSTLSPLSPLSPRIADDSIFQRSYIVSREDLSTSDDGECVRSVATSTTSESTCVEYRVPKDSSSLGITADVNQTTTSEFVIKSQVTTEDLRDEQVARLRQDEYGSGRDFSSKQDRAGSSSSKHSQTLRSDALALGYAGFDDPCDPGRLLVIHVESSQADLDVSEEIVFLHDEGMALVFGVGLPFSKVVLRSNGETALYEVGETKWRQLWISTESQTGSVKVFDARAIPEGVSQGTDSVHTGEVRGCVSDSKQASKFSPCQNSLSPFSSLLEAIGSRLSVRGSGGTSPDTLLTQMNNSRGVSEAGGSSGVVATEVRNEQQREREVTIEIHLDPYTSAFEGYNIPDELLDHRIEPLLVLTFFKELRGDQILRRFRSTLDFRFYMSGKIEVLNSDHEKFGWYHDDLELSFKCLSRNVATVDSEGVKGSCRRMTGRHDTPVQNMEEENVTGAGGNEHKKAGQKLVSPNNTGDATNDTATDFHVKLQGSPGGIGCLASIADDYKIWDMGGRKTAFFFSGMMSDSSFKLNGNWSIWSEGLTRYELIGKRCFILKVKRTNPPKCVGLSSFKTSNSEQDFELRISQKIRKDFQINHSFTTFVELSNWQMWRLALHAVAPHPISGMVDVVPMSCPGNGEPDSGGEQSFNPGFLIASDVNLVRNEVGPVSEMTGTLQVLQMASEDRDQETFSSESPSSLSHFPHVRKRSTVLKMANEDRNQETLSSYSPSSMSHFPQVFTEHLNGERVATKLNDYIYELYKPMTEPDMEIILCHGLDLDDSKNLHLSTWISGNVEKFHVWPKTWLAEDFPRAKVLTVSYDSSLYQTPELGRTDLHNTAENLMSNLRLLEDATPSLRPLILVGYSFGGILIKQLCLHAHQKRNSRYHLQQSEAFLKRIRAICFMGTPHRGMIHEGFEVPLQENAGPLFKDVKLLNKKLARLQEKFHDLRETYEWQISSVAETNETRWGAFQGVLVPESSARYGSGEQFIAVGADHRSLSKPSAKSSTIYKQLEALIKQAYSKVEGTSTT